MLDAPPGRGLGGENLIPSSRNRRRLVFLSMTQTLTKLEEAPKKEPSHRQGTESTTDPWPKATRNVAYRRFHRRKAETLTTFP